MPNATGVKFAGLEIDRYLGENSLFADIEGRHRALLGATATCIDLIRGQELWRPGMRASHLYLMLTGLTKRSSIFTNGSERVLDLLRAGDCLGAPELLAQRSHASYVIAVERSTLLRLDGESVRRVIEATPMLGLRLAQMLAARQLEFEHELGASQCRSSSQRALEYLLAQVVQPLASNGETPVRLTASKQLVASRIGMTPETFSRALRDLSNEGLLVVGGSSLRLQNAPVLLWQRRTNRAPAPVPRMHLVPSAGALPTLSGSCRPGVSRPLSYAAINMAGRQRMLSQRVAKYWLMLGNDICPMLTRKKLDQSIALFENQHLLLTDELTGSEQIATHREIGALWQQCRDVLDKASSPAQARELFALTEALLLATDRQMNVLTCSKATPQADFVNLAGRQRMLAQRMAKLHLFMAHGIERDTCEAGIDAAGSEFVNAMGQVTTIARAQPKLRKQLGKVTQYWNLMLGLLMERSGLRQAGETTVEICNVSDQLTRHMDGAVCLYAQMAEAA